MENQTFIEYEKAKYSLVDTTKQRQRKMSDTTKKDCVLPSAAVVAMETAANNFGKSFDEKTERGGCFQSRDAKIETGCMDYSFEAPSVGSQTSAAEKFQQIASPFSVAALLAAAELDEELEATHNGSDNQ